MPDAFSIVAAGVRSSDFIEEDVSLPTNGWGRPVPIFVARGLPGRSRLAYTTDSVEFRSGGGGGLLRPGRPRTAKYTPILEWERKSAPGDGSPSVRCPHAAPFRRSDLPHVGPRIHRLPVPFGARPSALILITTSTTKCRVCFESGQSLWSAPAERSGDGALGPREDRWRTT
jgi:hypothetical protein